MEILRKEKKHFFKKKKTTKGRKVDEGVNEVSKPEPALENKVASSGAFPNPDSSIVWSVIDSVDCLISVLDKNGRIIFINKTCEKKIKYSLSETKSLSFWDVFMSGKEKEKVKNLVKNVRENTFLENFDGKFKGIDGGTLTISWQGKVTLDSEGKIQYLIFYGTDITEKIRNQKAFKLKSQEIQKKERILRAITSSIPIVVLNIRKDKKGQISFPFVSEGIKEILGISPDNIYKDPSLFIKAIHQQHSELFLTSLYRSKNGLIPLVLEFQVCTYNNSYKWVRLNSMPKKQSNGVVVWEGTIKDISKQKRSEIKLKEQGLKLEKVNHELDRFVYSTSHDLRAPLTSALGLINLIKEEFKDDTLLKYISLTERSVVKLDKIIRSILDYSRNNRTEILSEEIKFKPILKSVLANYPSNNNIKINISVKQACSFYSDFKRLTVIMECLISNALRYFDAGKESFIYINVTTTHENATIKIQDNGIGIQENFLERIFDMFVRATEKSDGAGLGLYVAKEMVNNLGGTIKVESIVNEGSTFTLKIPNRIK